MHEKLLPKPGDSRTHLFFFLLLAPEIKGGRRVRSAARPKSPKHQDGGARGTVTSIPPFPRKLRSGPLSWGFGRERATEPQPAAYPKKDPHTSTCEAQHIFFQTKQRFVHSRPSGAQGFSEQQREGFRLKGTPHREVGLRGNRPHTSRGEKK